MSELSPSPSPSPPAAAPPPPLVAEVWRRFLEEPLSPDPPPLAVEPAQRRTLDPGTIFGDWEILRFLARGGMGEVFEAFYRPSHCRYALKVLGGDHHDDPDALTRFHYEYWALTTVKHEAIVAPFCAGKDDGLRWYAMELLEGESLDQVVERALLSPLPACRIGVTIADALTVIHASNIVHRDLKPGNIFLLKGSEDRVKLLDLGIAKLLPEFFADAEMRPRVEERLQTLPGTPIGTAGYMAPEVILGAKAAPAQDIYGLAATLFRLTVGRPPYATLLAPELGDEPRWSEALGRPLPRAFELVLRKALAVDPSCRQSSMSEFRDQLQLVVQELEAEAAEAEAAEDEGKGKGEDEAADPPRGDAALTVIETAVSTASEVSEVGRPAAERENLEHREAIAIEPAARPTDVDDLPAPIPRDVPDHPVPPGGDPGPGDPGSSSPAGGDGRADDPVDVPDAIRPPGASRRAIVGVACLCVALGFVVGFALGRVDADADAWVTRWAHGVAALPPREVEAASPLAPLVREEAAPDEPAPDEPAPDESAPEDAAPDEPAPDEPAPEVAAPAADQAAPTTPADTPPRRLGRTAFRRIVQDHQSALDPCIRVLPDGTEAAAEVRVRPDGSVERVRLVPEVSFIALRCVDKALGGLRFPQADAPSTHTWPLRRP